MDSLSTPSPLPDDSDEPPTPLRSPSRLDFCMEDGGDSPTHGMDWAYTSFRDECLYTVTEEDASALDIAPLDRPRLLIVEGGKEDPPQATDSHTHENTDTALTFFAPSDDPMDQVVIEPRAPIPVRPPSVQIHVDAQESMPPSRNATQRLNYPHHGFSRSALLQQKTLWNSRHEEWAEWQSRVEQGEALAQESETNNAYTGLATAGPRVAKSPPPYMRTPPSGLERDLADHPSKKRGHDVHASIYPRVGDVSALRDPYSVNIDRCFFKLPLWTLHKTLYVFDMQQRSPSLAPAYSTAHVQASTSSSTLSSYSSSTSGEDEESDSTLVADDSPVPKSQLPLEPLKSDSSLHSQPSWNCLYGWELSWYARWELLIGLFQRDHTKRDVFDIPIKLEAPLESEATPPSPPGRIFRFTVGEDEDENGDDEDEDYGMLVADSGFSADFDEECERAMAFYSRELKFSEVVL
jgi:hypothetical protein